MKVSVTEKHIKNGTPNIEESCPIALAVAENLKSQGIRNSHVHVNGDSIVVSFEIPLKKKQQEFVETFDRLEEPCHEDYEEGVEDKEFKQDLKEYEKLSKKIKPFDFELRN